MPERFWFGSMNDLVWTRFDPVLASDTILQVVVRRLAG